MVGVGNRGVFCDQIGLIVVDAAGGRYGVGVELRDAGTASLCLLDCLRGQDLVLVVDACKAGGRPGEIRLREVPRNAVAKITPAIGLHQIGPLETIAVAQHLFPETLPGRLLLILVETEGMDDAQQSTAVRQVLMIVDREIARYRAYCGEAAEAV